MSKVTKLKSLSELRHKASKASSAVPAWMAMYVNVYPLSQLIQNYRLDNLLWNLASELGSLFIVFDEYLKLLSRKWKQIYKIYK